jgi:hypothetical protein
LTAGSPPVFKDLNGTEIGQLAKAWVNFNGTGTTSTNQTIRASFNVASVFKNGTGDYTVNFTTALADANYSATITFGSSTSSNICNIGGSGGVAPTTTAIRVPSSNSASGVNTDSTYACVAVFR